MVQLSYPYMTSGKTIALTRLGSNPFFLSDFRGRFVPL